MIRNQLEHSRLTPLVQDPLYFPMPSKQVLHVIGDAFGRLQLHCETLHSSGASLHVEQTESNRLEGCHSLAQLLLGLVPGRFHARSHPSAFGRRRTRGIIVADFSENSVHLGNLFPHHRATRNFTVAGTAYPANSLIVRSDQSYAPHVYDMFEPQDHPNDFEYDGGPPVPPYDNAGYTLALQMGVQFDRILDGFDGPFEVVQGFSSPPPGRIIDADGAAGFLVSHAVTGAAIATNRLLAADQKVYWISEDITAAGQSWPAGTLWVPATATSREMIAEIAPDLGLDFIGAASTPSVDALELSPVTVGLWDQYGGSMSSGWTRWMFEQYEFPYEVVYPQGLNETGLENDFDVLVFEDGGIPSAGNSPGGRGGGGGGQGNIPQEYQRTLGRVTADETVPNLINYVRDGGTLLAIGSSTALATLAGLPHHVQQQPGLPPIAAGGPPRRHPSGVVRFRDPAAERLGVGGASALRRHDRFRGEARRGPHVPLWPAHQEAGSASRDLQVPLQRHPPRWSDPGTAGRHRVVEHEEGGPVHGAWPAYPVRAWPTCPRP